MLVDALDTKTLELLRAQKIRQPKISRETYWNKNNLISYSGRECSTMVSFQDVVTHDPGAFSGFQVKRFQGVPVEDKPLPLSLVPENMTVEEFNRRNR